MINTNTWNKIRYSIYQPLYDLVAVYFGQFRKRSIDELSISEHDQVLIIGAGTGLDLPYLDQSVSITAVDITPAMISKLDKRADKLGYSVQSSVMDGSALRFPTDSFDVVILHLILAVMPDPIGCLKETERVLKPGGRFTIMDKFIEPDTSPSFFRKTLNVFSTILATNLNRDIDSLLEMTSLKKTRHERLNQLFWIVQGEKINT